MKAAKKMKHSGILIIALLFSGVFITPAAIAYAGNDTIVYISQHSSAINLIMEELGIDTSDSEDFPSDENDKVDAYDNLWRIRIPAYEKIRVKNLVFDLTLERTK